MKINNVGIDFDNTIIIYDDVFHKYAVQLGLVSPEIEKNKQVIRDAIRMLPKGNDKWTELQGLVYGNYIGEARLADGVGQFLLICREESIKVSIISHKTVYPAIGSKVNLQEAAKEWIELNGFYSKYGLSPEDVVFEETLEGKLSQIKNRGCSHFIDDLSEVLFHPNFPVGVKKILYSQSAGWEDIRSHLFK